MDRRNFLRTMVGGLVAGAAVRTWPFRIYSFPSHLGAPNDLFGYVSYLQPGSDIALNNPRHAVGLYGIEAMNELTESIDRAAIEAYLHPICYGILSYRG